MLGNRSNLTALFRISTVKISDALLFLFMYGSQINQYLFSNFQETFLVCWYSLGGIDTERSYPYDGEDDVCRYNPKDKGATDKGFVDIFPG